MAAFFLLLSPLTTPPQQPRRKATQIRTENAYMAIVTPTGYAYHSNYIPGKTEGRKQPTGTTNAEALIEALLALPWKER